MRGIVQRIQELCSFAILRLTAMLIAATSPSRSTTKLPDSRPMFRLTDWWASAQDWTKQPGTKWWPMAREPLEVSVRQLAGLDQSRRAAPTRARLRQAVRHSRT